MQKIFILFFLLLSTSLFAQAYPKDTIDGVWKGQLVMGEQGTITYDLTLTVKTVKRKLVVKAETQYGQPLVTRAELSFSDVHTPLRLVLETFEPFSIPQVNYYEYIRLTLDGNWFEENLIEGECEQTVNDNPHLTSSGTFSLTRVEKYKKKRQRWL